MYALMKEAYRFDFTEFLEEWSISEEEYKEIKEWFKNQHGISL